MLHDAVRCVKFRRKKCHKGYGSMLLLSVKRWWMGVNFPEKNVTL